MVEKVITIVMAEKEEDIVMIEVSQSAMTTASIRATAIDMVKETEKVSVKNCVPITNEIFGIATHRLSSFCLVFLFKQDMAKVTRTAKAMAKLVAVIRRRAKDTEKEMIVVIAGLENAYAMNVVVMNIVSSTTATQAMTQSVKRKNQRILLKSQKRSLKILRSLTNQRNQTNQTSHRLRLQGQILVWTLVCLNMHTATTLVALKAMAAAVAVVAMMMPVTLMLHPIVMGVAVTVDQIQPYSLTLHHLLLAKRSRKQSHITSLVAAISRKRRIVLLFRRTIPELW
jgi:hypothetical protein